MMSRIWMAVPIWLCMTLGAMAQSQGRIDEMMNALGLPQMIEVMRLEGLAHSDDLRLGMFPDQAGTRWGETVAEIYDTGRLSGLVASGFVGQLGDEDIDTVLDFFQSPDGIEIIALEISARRALLDEQVGEANDAHVAQLRTGDDPRMELLAEFIEVNDLLETNVVGALNSNFSFFSGLVDGGAYDQAMGQDEILRQVWSQEAEIRADTEIWLYGFLSMAYSPLSDDQMQAYLDFSKTASGQRMNTVLFAVFNQMFDDVSYALGIAAAEMMKSEAL